jgi:hypothetical protein
MSAWDHIPTGGPGNGDARKRPKSRSPGPGERLLLAPLEESVGWYLTHYRNKRTKPCLGDLCGCQASEEKWPTRWMGYVLAMEMPKRVIVLAMLTRNCWEMCPALREVGEPLRGAQLILTRKGGSQGIVEAGIVPGFYPTAQLPVLPYTHKDQLMRVWFSGLDDYVQVNKFFDVGQHAAPLLDDLDQVDGPGVAKKEGGG